MPQTIADWLTLIFSRIYQILSIGGVVVPGENQLDLIAGPGASITSVDDPTNGITHVTIGAPAAVGGAQAVLTPIVVGGTFSPTQTQLLQPIAASTIVTGWTLTLPVCADGTILQLMDGGVGGSWSVGEPLLLQALGSGTVIQDPVAPTNTVAGSVGISFTRPGDAIRYMYLAVPNYWKVIA